SRPCGREAWPPPRGRRAPRPRRSARGRRVFVPRSLRFRESCQAPRRRFADLAGTGRDGRPLLSGNRVTRLWHAAPTSRLGLQGSVFFRAPASSGLRLRGRVLELVHAELFPQALARDAEQLGGLDALAARRGEGAPQVALL